MSNIQNCYTKMGTLRYSYSTFCYLTLWKPSLCFCAGKNLENFDWYLIVWKPPDNCMWAFFVDCLSRSIVPELSLSQIIWPKYCTLLWNRGDSLYVNVIINVIMVILICMIYFRAMTIYVNYIRYDLWVWSITQFSANIV